MKRRNSRNVVETYIEGKHLPLSDLKEHPDINNRYLGKSNIPAYPESVEFHVQKVSHVTGNHGLEGIFDDSGFRQPFDKVAGSKSHFIWWDLSPTSDDISSAEQGFLRSLFPDDAPIPNQLPFLEDFTSSKAFQKASSYGNFRFTFSLKELLWYYSNQFCDGQSPALSVYETVLYRREILYTVIVHPRDNHLYDDYPPLPKYTEGVCGYRNGTMWWRCQAPSETYRHKLEVDWHDCSVSVSPHREEYYVWDHVCVAFHMEPGWVLHVEREKLLNRLSVCEVAQPCLLRHPDTPLSVHEAESILTDLEARVG